MSTTTFDQPEWPFQRAGDECLSCKSLWEHHDPPLSPRLMVLLHSDDGTVIRTEEKGIEIAICPWCDGDVIMRLPKDV